MPRVRQLAPTWTEKESELVEKILSREFDRVRGYGPGEDYIIIDDDPFDGHPPSVRRRLIERLQRAHEKLRTALGITPAIATTPETETDIVTEIAK